MSRFSFPVEFTPKLFTTLRSGYGLADVRADALAGLTVAIVALPLAMALSIASGASPDKGLITAIVAGGLISLLGGSRVQIGGPTGAFVVVVFNVIAAHGYDGLLLATLMAGVILMVAGYSGFGRVIRYIPQPVVTGFTAGIAVIIASSQVRDFLGLQTGTLPADFIEKWRVYLDALGTLSMPSLALGAASLILIAGLKRWRPNMPGYLIAVFFGALAVAALHLPVETIGSRFPDMPHGLPGPHWPDFSFAKAQEVLPAAFTIAFLAGIEALLSAVVADGMTGYRHRPGQELVGQGVANIASAAFGGLPATGAIARTATNIKAGGKTPLSGVFHALFLLLFVLFASDLMAFVPMAVLAAVLFVVAWGMSESHRFVAIFKMGGGDRIVLVLTFLLTVLVDLTVGIAIGVGLASLLFMARMSQSVEMGLGRDFVSHDMDDEGQRDALPEGIEVFQIAGPLFFGVTRDLLDIFRQMGRMPGILIIRMRYVPMMDASAAAALSDLAQTARRQGVTLIFSAVRPGPAAMLARAGVTSGTEGIYFAADYQNAVDLARGLHTKKA